MRLVDITEVSAIVAAIGVIVGVAFTVLQLRDFVKTRHIDLVMRLYSTFGSKEYLEASRRVSLASKDHDAFLKKYGYVDVVLVGTLFEGIGILLKRKLMDIELIDDLFSEPVRNSWRTMKPIIEIYRKSLNQPRIFEWFEYLAAEMQKREQQLAPKTA
jgi:hypothetical protein